ncbi:hypothetical protein R0K17_05795 [Planococcus sp. SIMBA_143]
MDSVKDKPQFKDIWTTFKTDMQEGTKRINAEAKEDLKGLKVERVSSKRGWQLWGLALLTPVFLFGLFLLFIGGLLVWDLVFGL